MTAILLGAGGYWWHRGAPAPVPSAAHLPAPSTPPMTPEMRDALQTLPEVLAEGQAGEVAGVLDPMLVDGEGQPDERMAELPQGAYELRLACVAPGGRLRLTLRSQTGEAPSDEVLQCSSDLGWQRRTLIIPHDLGLATVVTLVENADSAVVAWRIIPHQPPGPAEEWDDQVLALLPDRMGLRSTGFELVSGQSRRHRFDLPEGAYSLRMACAGDTVVRVSVTGQGGQAVDMFCDADSTYLMDLMGGKVGGTFAFEALGGSGSAYVRAIVVDRIPLY
ncbi:hypothetical protein KUA19_25365 [Catellatospora sp. NEAU-YM18]|nr:hypothetical protein [Catellatospora tritici]